MFGKPSLTNRVEVFVERIFPFPSFTSFTLQVLSQEEWRNFPPDSIMIYLKGTTCNGVRKFTNRRDWTIMFVLPKLNFSSLTIDSTVRLTCIQWPSPVGSTE